MADISYEVFPSSDVYIYETVKFVNTTVDPPKKYINTRTTLDSFASYEPRVCVMDNDGMLYVSYDESTFYTAEEFRIDVFMVDSVNYYKYLWRRSFTTSIYPYDMAYDKISGFIYTVGFNNSYDLTLIKLNTNGDVIWEVTCPWVNTSYSSQTVHVCAYNNIIYVSDLFFLRKYSSDGTLLGTFSDGWNPGYSHAEHYDDIVMYLSTHELYNIGIDKEGFIYTSINNEIFATPGVSRYWRSYLEKRDPETFEVISTSPDTNIYNDGQYPINGDIVVNDDLNVFMNGWTFNYLLQFDPDLNMIVDCPPINVGGSMFSSLCLDIHSNILLATSTAHPVYVFQYKPIQPVWFFDDWKDGWVTSTAHSPYYKYDRLTYYLSELRYDSSNFYLPNTVFKAIVKITVHNYPNFIRLTHNFDTLNTIDEWLWDLDDGSYNQTPDEITHMYDHPGEFDIKLYVSNQDNSLEMATTYIVNTPTPHAVYDMYCPEGLYAPCKISFSPVMSVNEYLHETITDIEWIIDGVTYTTYTPVVLFTTGGWKSVQITVTNNYGLSSTLTDQFYIGDMNIYVNFTPSRMDIMTDDFPVNIQFKNLSHCTTDLIYFWDFGSNGMSYESDPLRSFTAWGKYTISLTAVNEITEKTKTYVNCINIHYKTKELFDRVTVSDTPTKFKGFNLIDRIKSFDTGTICNIILDKCNIIQKQFTESVGIDDQSDRNFAEQFNEWGIGIYNRITGYGRRIIKPLIYNPITGFIIFRSIYLEDKIIIEDKLEKDEE
jgi:PKD repeat protein